MTGEEFLRRWAAEIVAAGDFDWYQRFYSLVEALEIVDAVDIDVARDIGQGVRAGLTARTGRPAGDFYLGSRHAPRHPFRGRAIPPPTAAPHLAVRAALGSLPEAEGDGGTKFVTVENGSAWVVCSGAGDAPWPDDEPVAPEPRQGDRPSGTVTGQMISAGVVRAPIGPPSPPFFDVLDNHGRHYHLSVDCSSAGASGEKRQRWELRAGIEPVPGENVAWLEFVTAHGPVRAHLRPPVPTAISQEAMDPVPSELEHHLAETIHTQVWLHLLDPDRPLEPVGIIAEALIAVGAIDPADPLVEAMFAVDAALASTTTSGAPTSSAALPDVLRAARRRDSTTVPWLGVEALGVPIEFDGVFVTLEALVGHCDRLALHFTQSPLPFPPPSNIPSAHELIVWATDDRGGGYAGHAEPIGGMEQGAYHLRPPLDSASGLLTIHLQGSAHRVTVDIDLSQR